MVSPSPSEPLRRIGRYDVLTLLSIGGMAELYLACITGPGGFRKFVAVKRILPALRHEEEFVAMFLDEARITASLTHANIAQVFDLAEDSDELFIAMEFVAGQDLSRMVRAALARGERLPLGLATAVVRDACLALHYAHTFTSASGRPLPVIHRDLTPRNVMLTYSGTTKLIDFGIAKARGGLSTTQSGRVKGSIGYMSPEQVRGEELSGRSDLFSAGVVLHELLTGHRLFHTGDDASTMYRVLNHVPAPPHEATAGVPEALSRVVMRALDKDPERRFTSGREMARAIEEATGGALFREEQSSRWMAVHFADAMARIRELYQLAGELDGQKLARAASWLHELQTPGAVAGAPRSRNAPPPSLASAADVDTKTSPSAPPARPGTVLVVDDTQVGRMLVERVLERDEHRVVTASSGAEALEILQQIKSDLIILDINMPEMDGFELCQRIRAENRLRSVPVIFLSAQCSLSERQRGLQVGGDDFLRKPYEAAELSSLVRRHLRRAQQLAGQGGVGDG